MGGCSEYSDFVQDKHGPITRTTNYTLAVDGEFSESVQSLDIWPPMIPKHSELKYIVADQNDHEPKDICASDDYNIDMVPN